MAATRSWFAGAGEGEHMITDPLATLIGKIVVSWMQTSLFSVKLKSVTEQWFEAPHGCGWLVDSSEIICIGVMWRC